MTQIEQWVREEGREEDEKEARKKTAIIALQKGLDVEFVAEITGLSKEEILELKSKKIRFIYNCKSNSGIAALQF